MKSLIPLILACAMASCAHRGPAPSPVLPVPKAVVVTPDVQAISPSVDRVSDANSKLKGQVGALQAQAKTAREEADRAMAEAARLVVMGSATKGELEGMWRSLQSVSARNLFLETELIKTNDLLNEQSTALIETRNKLSAAISSAGAADMAAQRNEAQLTAVTNQFVQAKSESDELAKLNAAKGDRIDLLEWWLWRLGIAVAGYVLLRVLKLTPWGRVWLFWVP